VIAGLPHQAALRIGMTLFGAGMYVLVVRLLAVTVRPFVPVRSAYNPFFGSVSDLPPHGLGCWTLRSGSFGSSLPAVFIA
jgi:hypothetical protein